MLYNLTEIEEIAGGDHETLLFIINQCVADIETSLVNINIALPQKDLDAIKFNAHRIRPAISHLQIISLYEIIAKIETLATTNVYDNVLVNLIQELNATMTTVLHQLKSRSII